MLSLFSFTSVVKAKTVPSVKEFNMKHLKTLNKTEYTLEEKSHTMFEFEFDVKEKSWVYFVTNATHSYNTLGVHFRLSYDKDSTDSIFNDTYLLDTYNGLKHSTSKILDKGKYYIQVVIEHTTSDSPSEYFITNALAIPIKDVLKLSIKNGNIISSTPISRYMSGMKYISGRYGLEQSDNENIWGTITDSRKMISTDDNVYSIKYDKLGWYTVRFEDTFGTSVSANIKVKDFPKYKKVKINNKPLKKGKYEVKCVDEYGSTVKYIFNVK